MQTSSFIVRTILSAAAAAVPALTYLMVRHALDPGLPAELPIHWGADGLSDAVAVTNALAGQTLTSLLFGVGIALVGYSLVWQSHLVRRVVIAVGSSVSAVSAGTWFSAVLAMREQSDALGVPLGAGVLFGMFGVVFGLVPALLFRPAAPLGRRPAAGTRSSKGD